MIVERILTGAVLALVTWFSYQCLAMTVLSIGQLIYIIVKRPYADKNWRPIVNMIITTLVLVIYYLMNSMDNSTIKEYGPFGVLALLSACLIYSTILLVLQFKDTFTKMFIEDDTSR